MQPLWAREWMEKGGKNLGKQIGDGAVVAQLILSHSDNFSWTLQKVDVSAAAGQDVAEITVKTVISYKNFWQKLQLGMKGL